jgi:hypothetical protein
LPEITRCAASAQAKSLLRRGIILHLSPYDLVSLATARWLRKHDTSLASSSRATVARNAQRSECAPFGDRGLLLLRRFDAHAELTVFVAVGAHSPRPAAHVAILHEGAAGAWVHHQELALEAVGAGDLGLFAELRVSSSPGQNCLLPGAVFASSTAGTWSSSTLPSRDVMRSESPWGCTPTPLASMK